MCHRVYHRFPHGHSDLHQIAFVETRPLSHAQRQLLGAIHAPQCGIQKPFYSFPCLARVFLHTQNGQNAWPKRIVRINYRLAKVKKGPACVPLAEHRPPYCNPLQRGSDSTPPLSRSPRICISKMWEPSWKSAFNISVTSCSKPARGVIAWSATSRPITADRIAA